LVRRNPFPLLERLAGSRPPGSTGMWKSSPGCGRRPAMPTQASSRNIRTE